MKLLIRNITFPFFFRFPYISCETYRD